MAPNGLAWRPKGSEHNTQGICCLSCTPLHQAGSWHSEKAAACELCTPRLASRQFPAVPATAAVATQKHQPPKENMKPRSLVRGIQQNVQTGTLRGEEGVSGWPTQQLKHETWWRSADRAAAFTSKAARSLLLHLMGFGGMGTVAGVS